MSGRLTCSFSVEVGNVQATYSTVRISGVDHRHNSSYITRLNTTVTKKSADRQTERLRQTDRQTDRQTHRQTDTQTDGGSEGGSSEGVSPIGVC